MAKKIKELKLDEIKEVAGGVLYVTATAYKAPTYTSTTTLSASSILLR
jgi:hypothetical protein